MSVANVWHVYVVLYKWRVIHCQFLKQKVFFLRLYKNTVTAQCFVTILGLEFFKTPASVCLTEDGSHHLQTMVWLKAWSSCLKEALKENQQLIHPLVTKY